MTFCFERQLDGNRREGPILKSGSVDRRMRNHGHLLPLSGQKARVKKL